MILKGFASHDSGEGYPGSRYLYPSQQAIEKFIRDLYKGYRLHPREVKLYVLKGFFSCAFYESGANEQIEQHFKGFEEQVNKALDEYTFNSDFEPMMVRRMVLGAFCHIVLRRCLSASVPIQAFDLSEEVEFFIKYFRQAFYVG